ncbi:unnamed protein product [Rotaria socialis]|uniref:Chromatin modification-related protein MEAF6 n=2 Tax=Rotaria socialis TaxID=392032 RepID=A0A817U0Z4_9BILA|nr:unnamed protein product [Rotaria socialis]CAF3325637.1 unnamed protein product [Rotaria socialis]CAF3325643.1 unnamed protein product [Rotaria socialis]CAF3325649.1 unnamed protein product [Rotaria socialis]CAF3486214.1 unnamed protein product [Rotaria socialis]
MKDSSVAATSPAPASPTTNKEKPTINHVFRDTRSELAQLLKKKEEIEKSLSDIEEQIYAFETSYLKQTQDTGNCIRGWSSCLTNGNGNNNSNDKSAKFRESDRLFSYSSATSYTLLGRDRLKREREKERRKNIRKHREIMQELSTNKKNTSIVSENNTQLTQPINDEGDEDIVDEDESTTSSEKPPSRSMTNTSTSSKRRTKSKSLRNKRALSDSSQHSES